MKTCICIPFLLLTLFAHTANSTTWITIDNGNWNDSSVWLTGIVPSTSVTDTIIIKDTVYFDTDIFMNPGSFMQIDSLGGALCGHHNITVYSGAVLNKYGALSLDTLFVKGGTTDFILPGPFLMMLTRVTDGGSFHVYAYAQSCMCPWDTCFIPIPYIIPPEEPVIINAYDMFPNPSNGNFSLQYTQQNESTIYIYNTLGQLLFSKTLEGNSGLKNFTGQNMENGMYFWEVVSGDTVFKKGKQLIVR